MHDIKLQEQTISN